MQHVRKLKNTFHSFWIVEKTLDHLNACVRDIVLYCIILYFTSGIINNDNIL